MLPLETLISFSVASILLSFAPGPDNIFVLLQSAMHGRRAGIIVSLGLCTGLVGHTLAVTLGLAAIFQVSLAAFTVLKVAGAGYLLYLACQAFRAGSTQFGNHPILKLSDAALYRRGILMSSLNPKLVIFFVAFLPQFTDPSLGSISWQLLQLGGLFIVIGFFVMSFIALLSDSIRSLLQSSPGFESYIHKLASLVFIGLALKLVSAER